MPGAADVLAEFDCAGGGGSPSTLTVIDANGARLNHAVKVQKVLAPATGGSGGAVLLQQCYSVFLRCCTAAAARLYCCCRVFLLFVWLPHITVQGYVTVARNNCL